MNNTALTVIEKTFETNRSHWTRSRPYGQTNLSEFICSCGQIFTPISTWAPEPREWPTLPELHRALATAQAIDESLVLPGVDDLDQLPTGAVASDAYGLLYRKTGDGRWIDQLGARHTSTSLSIHTMVLVWAPTR